ncbi:hypothetical protein VTJ04DRAFT_7410 [Mycothermus thermophilus]|uniref:uncharacterized protein n=1 Tax=Humicola insolens TaxID=85995 RepID=UPI003743D73B
MFIFSFRSLFGSCEVVSLVTGMARRVSERSKLLMFFVLRFLFLCFFSPTCFLSLSTTTMNRPTTITTTYNNSRVIIGLLFSFCILGKDYDGGGRTRTHTELKHFLCRGALILGGGSWVRNCVVVVFNGEQDKLAIRVAQASNDGLCEGNLAGRARLSLWSFARTNNRVPVR